VEPVPVGQAVDRDHRFRSVRTAGQVERRAQRGGAPDVPDMGDFVAVERVAVHDQPGATPQTAADHRDLGRGVGPRRAARVEQRGRGVPESTPRPSTRRYAASERSSRSGGPGHARA
jgi:hypothetical protein